MAWQGLKDAWKKAVVLGKTMREFEARLDDPEGGWSKGDRIAFGVVSNGGGFRFHAKNLTKANPIRQKVREKQVGGKGFVCQFNGYRLLRTDGNPLRPGLQADLSADPTRCRFLCQNSEDPSGLLRSDPLDEVRLKHFRWRAFYNAVPFDKDGHFLWVPVIVKNGTLNIPHYPQQLSRELFEDLVILFSRSGPAVLFFNSRHAGASVDHIHAQAVFHTRPLAIEGFATVIYRGFRILENYPAQAFCFRLDSRLEEIVICIDRLQREAIPLNVIMVGDRIFIIPRNKEQEVVSEFPGGVFGSMELAGRIITVDARAYKKINDTTITAAFKRTTLPVRALIDRWETGKGSKEWLSTYADG